MDISKSGAMLLLALAALRPAAALCATAQGTKPAKSATSRPTGDAAALKQAEGLLEKQQFAEAEAKLQVLAPGQGENPQFWFDLGFAKDHLEKTGEAIMAYKKAARLEPKWFEASLNLGIALARSGDLQQAATTLEHTVELKPLSGGNQPLAKAWLSLAKVKEQSDPQAALAAYLKATELDPNNAEAYVSAGSLQEQAGNVADAEKNFTKAAELNNSAALSRLVNLLAKQKRFADAETWLRKYVEQQPQDAAARGQLGRLLAMEGKPDDAIAMLAPLSGPEAGADINRELASLYLEKKQYIDAASAFRLVLAKNDSDAESHSGLGVALLHQLKYGEAEAELLKALKLKPSLTDAYGYLADAARQNKHYELAIKALDARAKFQAETPATYFLRATAYDSLRLYKPAVENYKLFLAAAAGQFPDQEFQARHRLKAIEPK